MEMLKEEDLEEDLEEELKEDLRVVEGMELELEGVPKEEGLVVEDDQVKKEDRNARVSAEVREKESHLMPVLGFQCVSRIPPPAQLFPQPTFVPKRVRSWHRRLKASNTFLHFCPVALWSLRLHLQKLLFTMLVSACRAKSGTAPSKSRSRKRGMSTKL